MVAEKRWHECVRHKTGRVRSFASMSIVRYRAEKWYNRHRGWMIHQVQNEKCSAHRQRYGEEDRHGPASRSINSLANVLGAIQHFRAKRIGVVFSGARAHAAACSTLRVPSKLLRSVAVKPGHAALTMMRVDSSSNAKASVIALKAVFDLL
jgi:hypothetical protein